MPELGWIPILETVASLREWDTQASLRQSESTSGARCSINSTPAAWLSKVQHNIKDKNQRLLEKLRNKHQKAINKYPPHR
jgi:hypothetical protein